LCELTLLGLERTIWDVKHVVTMLLCDDKGCKIISILLLKVIWCGIVGVLVVVVVVVVTVSIVVVSGVEVVDNEDEEKSDAVAVIAVVVKDVLTPSSIAGQF